MEGIVNVVIFKKGKHYDGIRPIISEHTENDGHILRKDVDIVHYLDDTGSGVHQLTHGNVRILSMNICGLSNWKLVDDVLGLHFKSFDIILLQETWSTEGDEFSLEGYEYS